MAQSIDIVQYRKLKGLSISLSPHVNAISGTNGTCKTSLLHIISNSFQSITSKCDWVNDPKCISAISAVNDSINPKVEGLTRGDKTYNDPAHGVRGALFTVNYFDHDALEFRRHNSSITTRYAVKPKYSPGTKQTLPYCPVIYMGLSRLLPFGEFQNDDVVVGIKKKLPEQYQNEISQIYKTFTKYDITYGNAQQMGDIKTRSEFDCAIEGIDSNTISAGEDNLFIILTALVSLKYYYQCCTHSKTVENILLIDEVDATLHPAYQIKLLNLFREFSELYKIQIVFTTHSMSLIESMLDKKDNIIYLLDNVTSVSLMENPDVWQIKMHLQSLTTDDIYTDRVIPIFSEDDEARFLINLLTKYFMEIHPDEFRGVSEFFHFVQTNISAENLIGIFTDSKLLKICMRSICILDGDHDSDLNNCILALPTLQREAPEQLLLNYAKKLYTEDSPFWTERIVITRGFGKPYYIEKIAEPVEKFEEDLENLRTAGKSTKGKTREFNKELFNKNRSFFELLFKRWLHDPNNSAVIEKFYKGFRILFKKIAPYNEINPNEWK